MPIIYGQILRKKVRFYNNIDFFQFKAKEHVKAQSLYLLNSPRISMIGFIDCRKVHF